MKLGKNHKINNNLRLTKFNVYFVFYDNLFQYQDL